MPDKVNKVPGEKKKIKDKKGKKDKKDEKYKKDKDARKESLEGQAIDGLVMAAMAEPEDMDLPPIPTPRIKRYPRHRPMTFGRCIKKFLVFLLSYVGLTMIVVAYSIMGGVVFVALESPNEEDVNHKVFNLRQKHLKNLSDALKIVDFNDPDSFNDSNSLNDSKAEKWKIHANKVMLQFQSDIYELVSQEGWSGDDVHKNKTDLKWSFAGGLLYSVTVITTIGYGFITPRTYEGRAITMLYALIGIPLTFLCLANIGRFMAACFRTMYGRTFCVTCRRNCIECFTTCKSDPELSDEEFDEKGIPHFAQNNETDFIDEKECEEKHDETEVPVIVCLILVVWYIVFGAIMFTIWEKDWDIFTGAYFCFITLSTIGFGDIVPGFSHDDWNDQVKLVACSCYLLIGLSTLAMCFELMQHKGQKVARQCGQFIGLVHK